MLMIKLSTLVLTTVLCQCSPLRDASDVIETQKFYEKGDFVEGDMRFATQISTRAGIIDVNRRWTNNTIFFEISPEFTSAQQDTILDGLNEIEANTCLQFVQRIDEPDYIYVQANKSGCWSFIGRLSGRQPLNLEIPGCISKGVVMHEFNHALGFYHQHSSSQRDEYVEILKNNVKPGKLHNFVKYGPDRVSDYNVGYDYLSVMHYSATAFSKNGNTTIVTKDPAFQNMIGRSNDLSLKDIAKIRAMYSCPESELVTNE